MSEKKIQKTVVCIEQKERGENFGRSEPRLHVGVREKSSFVQPSKDKEEGFFVCVLFVVCRSMHAKNYQQTDRVIQ